MSRRIIAHVWLIPALIVLALIIIAVITVGRTASLGMSWDIFGHITDVVQNGPAANVGIHTGDIIQTIGTCPVKEYEQCPYTLVWPGDMIYLKVSREENFLGFALIAQRLTLYERMELWGLLLLASIFCLSPVLLLFKRLEALEVRLFYTLSLIAALSLIALVYTYSIIPYGPPWLHLLNGILPPVVVHLHAVFPEKKTIAHTHWLWVMLYATGFVLSIARYLRPQLGFPSLQFATTVMHVWVASGLLVAILSVVATYIQTTSQDSRHRIRVVVLGAVLGFSPTAFFSATLRSGFSADPWLRLPLLIPLAGVLPVAYTFALWRQPLNEFDRKLNRSLGYFFLGSIVFGVYFLGLSLLAHFIPASILGRAVLGAVVAILVALTFQPLRSLTQSLVDRLFYGGWYDVQALIKRADRALISTTEKNLVIETLIHDIPTAMYLPGAALWLKNKDQLVRVGLSDPALSHIQAEDLTPIKDVCIRGNVMLVPFIAKGQLIGIWALASRRDGEWRPEDRQVLLTLGRRAALTAQNLDLLDTLQGKVRESEDTHRRLLSAREEERMELARELHDGVIQDLIGLRYHLETIQLGDVGTEALKGIHSQVGVLIEEIKRLSSALHPHFLDELGLGISLRSLAREITTRGLPVKVVLDEFDVPDEVAIELYRIAQEALANAWRHADASEAILTLQQQENEILLSIIDQGRGFNASDIQAKGFGLTGMQERAQALSGSLHLDSAPGQGTRVTVRCPKRN